jgi:hypothetical protein
VPFINKIAAPVLKQDVRVWHDPVMLGPLIAHIKCVGGVGIAANGFAVPAPPLVTAK